MRNLSQPGALFRNSTVISRVVAPSESVAVAPFRQLIGAHRQTSNPSPVRSRSSPPCASVRHFSQSPVAAKKKAPRNSTSSSSSPPPSSATPKAGAKPNLEDAFDLADLEAAFAKGTEHYLNELTKARSGGRFNPDVIGALRVRPDKSSPQTFPLHELAAIVPKRGSRKVSILVHELANVKPIMTAIQASPDFNQQPQRVEDNEQELVLTVEAEDPEEAAKRLKDILNAWRQQVRDAKHKREQVVKKWLKDGKIVRDDFTRLEKEMQKLQDKKMAEIKAKEKEVEGKS